MVKEILMPGTRIQKINSRAGDLHRDGAEGTVRGYVGPLPDDAREQAGMIGYCVNWDDMPAIEVWIAGNRVKKAAG